MSAESQAAALELWHDHRRDVRSSPPADSALFEVIEGEGDYLLVHEFHKDGSDSVTPSIRDRFGNSNVVDCTIFSRIFAATDARVLSKAARFLFLARANVDHTLDHVEFNDWYDSTHVPEVSSVGLLRAQRFRSRSDNNDYLASYEIAAPAVLTSDELAQVRGFHQFTSHIQRLRRTVARQIRTANG